MSARPPKPEGIASNPRFQRRKAKIPADMKAEFAALYGTVAGKALPFLDQKRDDTTIAILATSVIDHLMKLAVTTKFRRDPSKADLKELFEGNGPLSRFSAKVTLCSLIGLLNLDMKSDLQRFGFIRNQFAHSPVTMTFDSPKIVEACNKLRAPGIFMPKAEITPPARKLFVGATLRLMVELIGKAILGYGEANLVEAAHHDIVGDAMEQMAAMVKGAKNQTPPAK